jgi:hypothetical protein
MAADILIDHEPHDEKFDPTRKEGQTLVCSVFFLVTSDPNIWNSANAYPQTNLAPISPWQMNPPQKYGAGYRCLKSNLVSRRAAEGVSPAKSRR